MRDPRIEKLANNLIRYSVDLQKDEKILIESIGFETPLVKELIRQTYLAGGIPFVTVKNPEILRVLLSECSEEQVRAMASLW